MPTPSEMGSRALDVFIDLRDSLRDQRIGRGGHEVSAALTERLDTAIASLVDPLPERVSVLALGGYGRRELSPYSDVDLMLLHEVDDPSEMAADLFRPLWDVKLRVGHSVRTVKESAAAARERFDTQTTLLTSRLIAGDPTLYGTLMEAVTAVTRARPLRRHLVAEERRRRAETPFLRMAVDVKTGRGGMRALQAFEWERRREGLIGRFSPEPGPEEDQARQSLLRIRNAIHVVTGRRHDEFSVDLREPVARWLETEVFEVAQELITAMRTVDWLAGSRWPEVVDDDPRVGRRTWLRVGGRPVSQTLHGPPGLGEILWMLETGEQGRVAFERLWAAGMLDDVLPEWGVVRGLPQLAPFHEHPVDAHLWRTVAEMRALMTTPGQYQRIARDLGDDGLLLLAAFLHDIGKGRHRHHAEEGAEIAIELCRRLEVSTRWAQDLEHAVLHHLLLAETATRRDLDDPAVIDEIAEIVGNPRRLQLLYLLTVADSRATGPTMWSEWKAQLLRALFIRVTSALEGDQTLGTTRGEVVSAAGENRAEVEGHIDRMPADYLSSTTAEDILWHVAAIASRAGRSFLDVRAGGSVERAVIIGDASPAFRRRVAESFAANGIDVLEAKMSTRSDGLVVDTFCVRHDRTGGEIGDERWGRARRDVEAAVGGQLDIVSKMEERASAYQSLTAPVRKPTVDCSTDPATGDVVVVVKCSDRIGRLAEILGALGECGLDVRLAKLDSRGEELVDTFHVRADGGMSDLDSMEGLGQLIAAGITP